MVDLACSLALVAAALVVGVAFAARPGEARDERVERAGASPLLGKRPMEATYWALRPITRACVGLGVSANAVTWGSLLLAAGAGVAIALGHYGAGAAFALASALGDAVDGSIARETGTSSDSGEVLDAAVDRYAELLFLGGVAFHERHDAVMLLLALLATAGSLMVSYATAKAEALHVKPPRGAMRRPERAVYLIGGAALAPIAVAVSTTWGLPAWLGSAPVLAALAIVGVVGNVSAVRSLRAIAEAVRKPTSDDATSDDAPARIVRRTAPSAASATLRTIGRHQAGAIVATVVDFGAMVLLVETHLLSPVVATACGASLGAATNFAVGRTWIFRAQQGTLGAQAARYAVVSAASAALNAIGEYLVHGVGHLQYVAARALVAVAVSLLWNFPMQRRFVFREETA